MTTMTVEEAIGALASADGLLPQDAMQWSLDHWNEAGPPLLGMLRDYATGADRSDEAANTLFFALHLMGGRGETRAFADICRLLHDGDAGEEILGDAITETLNGILIQTFDGDRARLEALVDDAAIDDFIRQAGLMAMAYLTRTGRIGDTEMRDCLVRLLAGLDPDLDDVMFWSCAMAVACLGYEELAPRVEALFERNDDPYPLISVDDFREIMAMAKADPTGIAGFTDCNVEPFTDPIGVLGTWPSLSGEETSDFDDERQPPDWTQAEPLVNPFRHVGRNDPCPCGSGKKFKKCCLPLAS